MAKSKAKAKRKGASRRRGAGARTRAGKGEGLEIGNARRDAGAATPLPRAVAKQPRRQAIAQIPGEKAVGGTDQTVPVRRERPAPGDREPMPEVAIDHRRQVIGTDGKRGRRR